MGELIYISGGCRSGKSRYAQYRAEALNGRRVYIATSRQICSNAVTRMAPKNFSSSADNREPNG
ncbi:MAG: bifunctional adenosylcobinamide kinase/adenosylcobinamide-phosphate guanylyltransferase, partial [Desulfuromonadales bacterium]|nr:bifunctional adenosylcobinamide kinase/adenosylcobinamide-phosphate guanylyltransferase [Desulfuromonadales bacterium]MBN2792299.1 bifunctional adenosylcobinamide kinase/adenosylcobinamide-phosphate guanylyltransferase [Desulfuromonadales bacterium]